MLTTVVAVAVVLTTQAGNPAATRAEKQAVGKPKEDHKSPPGMIPDVESKVLPWSLAAPLSRMVVEPSAGTQLTVLGGYGGESSADGVYDLDTTNGHLTLVGNLAVPTHDAAGAVLGSRDLVIGGRHSQRRLSPGPRTWRGGSDRNEGGRITGTAI